MTPEARLAALGLRLPPAWEPGASLEMCVRHGDLLYLSGHMGVDMSRVVAFHGRDDHHPLVPGRVGAEVRLEGALEIARGGALNLIATVKDQIGDLSGVSRIVKTTALVNAADEFSQVHKVADAASDLLIEVFGEAGRHARTAIGVRGLPADSCFAIEALIAVS